MNKSLKLCLRAICAFSVWMGATSAFASTVFCGAAVQEGQTESPLLFSFEDGVIKFVDFEGNVAMPYDSGLLCGVGIDKEIGETQTHIEEDSNLLTFKVGISGYIVNEQKGFKVLASEGGLSVTKATNSGRFTCSYGGEEKIVYHLKNCVIR